MMGNRTTIVFMFMLCCPAWAAEDVAPSPPEAASLTHQTPGYEVDAVTIPRMLSYQGKLTDTAGRAVRDSEYTVLFGLYTVPSGGSAFWNETQTVRTKSGLFSVLLGSVTPIGSMPDAGAAYLGMAVAGGAELTPRLRIASAAYAFLTERAGNSDLLQGRDTTTFSRAGHNHDATYVNEGQADAVTSGMIVNGTIAAADLGQMGASTGQVLKWTGSAWEPRNDSVGSGSGDNAWIRVGSDSVLYTINRVGIGRGGSLNLLNGTQAFTQTNLGAYQCTTGVAGTSYNYQTISGGTRCVAESTGSTVGGGNGNKARGQYATVAGGYLNTATGSYATVSGGYQNSASGYRALVGGGSQNIASGEYAAVAAGYSGTARARFSGVLSGGSNVAGDDANDTAAVVAGGYDNSVTGRYALVGGGYRNIARGEYSVVGGGFYDTAVAQFSGVFSGYSNLAGDTAAVAAGGWNNSATGRYATVGGGYQNVAGGTHAVVSGGFSDTARAAYSGVFSGYSNLAGDTAAVVVGGWNNSATGRYATVGGGAQNTATGSSAVVSGGSGNTASGSQSTISGGQDNAIPSGTYHATISGGTGNIASSNGATIGGGSNNTASGISSTVPGGESNAARGWSSFAAGTRARSNHSGSFVWGDWTGSSSDTVYTTGDNQFRVRARGGTWFFSNAGMTTGAYLAPGSNSWASACDSATKEDFRDVDRKELLKKVAGLRVRNYKMKDQHDGTRHIGPVA
ncbi:MAG: hypothetical protein ABIK86_02615, partial [candidate division WOR-3 bacterium]